jgi:hypothetical protein
MGEWMYRSTLLDLGTSWRWVVRFTSLPLYPRGKSLRHPLDMRLSGHRNRSGRRGEDPTGTRNSDPSVFQAVASRYTDYVIPAADLSVILILFSHVRHGFQSGLFPWSFPTAISHTLLVWRAFQQPRLPAIANPRRLGPSADRYGICTSQNRIHFTPYWNQFFRRKTSGKPHINVCKYIVGSSSTTCVWSYMWQEVFSLLPCVNRLCSPSTFLSYGYWRQIGRSVNLTAKLHPVPRSRILGAFISTHHIRFRVVVVYHRSSFSLLLSYLF